LRAYIQIGCVSGSTPCSVGITIKSVQRRCGLVVNGNRISGKSVTALLKSSGDRSAIGYQVASGTSRERIEQAIETYRTTIIAHAIRDRLAYCTTKFAVVGLTKAMALDHAGQGIRVNCICPARVETPFVKARLAEYPNPEAAYRDMSSTQLFGRLIRPEEVAASAVYLASDESHMVTGTAFLIDCGWTTGK
jgi:NAD(P)-dependent dehydrogenase (short-subunit alcohol dehydrogenase family)